MIDHTNATARGDFWEIRAATAQKIVGLACFVTPEISYKRGENDVLEATVSLHKDGGLSSEETDRLMSAAPCMARYIEECEAAIPPCIPSEQGAREYVNVHDESDAIAAFNILMADEDDFKKELAAQKVIVKNDYPFPKG